jgi:hypothetical protein
MPLLMTEVEEGKGKITGENEHRQKYKYKIVFHPTIILSLCKMREERDV